MSFCRCPGCGVNKSRDCGYLDRNPYNGDCDCAAPDADELDACEDCHHLYCITCALKEEMEFEEEEFDV